MNANKKVHKILRELEFDFATFTMDRFFHAVGKKKVREIIPIPWKMPPAMFGAWISDSDESKEYIFYRDNVSETH